MTVAVTALDLIKLALKTAGILPVGQTPQNEDANDALTILNSMLASWNQSRWMIYHLIDIAKVSTGGASYTVGPTGDFNVARPDRIEAAYVRLLTSSSGLQSDFPLHIIETQEEYSQISLKKLVSFPSLVFYDPTLVLGTLYVYPIALSGNYELHILVKETLGQFSDLTSVFNLPPEYYEALFYNLTARISLMYQVPVNPGVIALAKAALNMVQIANHRVPDLEMPSGLMRNSGMASNGNNVVGGTTFQLDRNVLGPL